MCTVCPVLLNAVCIPTTGGRSIPQCYINMRSRACVCVCERERERESVCVSAALGFWLAERRRGFAPLADGVGLAWGGRIIQISAQSHHDRRGREREGVEGGRGLLSALSLSLSLSLSLFLSLSVSLVLPCISTR